jgi:predicted Zn finger-like uncharacterized protein
MRGPAAGRSGKCGERPVGVRGMRIECPGCEAAYEVPERQIRPGRSVQCARCALQWQPAGDPPGEAGPPAARTNGVQLRQSAAPAPVPDAAAMPAPGPASPGPWPRPGHAEPGPGDTGWRMGWAASLLVLAGLLVSAAHWRTPIMQHWPPSIRLYTMLGYAVLVAQAPRS